MACTTILVGKNASYDGSTMIARNDDSGSGHFTAKKFVVIHPEEQLKVYKSVLSHAEIDLPGDPMKFTAVPNAIKGKGIWAADYEQIMFAHEFWAAYAEEVKLCKALEEVYSM